MEGLGLLKAWATLGPVRCYSVMWNYFGGCAVEGGYFALFWDQFGGCAVKDSGLLWTTLVDLLWKG